jgi:hypothetical protein
VGDLDPFFVFKVLVVLKEMFDLLDRYHRSGCNRAGINDENVA